MMPEQWHIDAAIPEAMRRGATFSAFASDEQRGQAAARQTLEVHLTRPKKIRGAFSMVATIFGYAFLSSGASFQRRGCCCRS